MDISEAPTSTGEATDETTGRKDEVIRRMAGLAVESAAVEKPAAETVSVAAPVDFTDITDSKRGKAESYKLLGNSAFKNKNFDDAIAQYTAAIDVAYPGDKALLATCHLNRAMAKLKLAEPLKGDASSRRSELLEAVIKDSKAGAQHDPTNAKAPFREALALLQLGRVEDAKSALYRAFRLDPANKEVVKLLVEHDETYANFEREITRLQETVAEKRNSLHMMTHRSHPMNMRSLYYRTWMAVWSPEDRECALSHAFMEVLKSFDERLKDEAREIAVFNKRSGKVDFGEDGFGVWRHMNEKNTTLKNEGYDLASIVLEDLVCDKCYHEPEIYCATVEKLAEGREEEPDMMPEERRARLHALRPKILMGEMCAEHPLKEWMIARMGDNLRKQILLGVCLTVCMAATGLVKAQLAAMHELRNLKRKEMGLKALMPGEEEEDDVIMDKDDYDEYQERKLLSGPVALDLLQRGSQAMPEDLREPKGLLTSNINGALLDSTTSKTSTDGEGQARLV